ncbi:MAG: nucleotide pyrophosphohydrolase [Actinomycetia bacterium]|nr:nucleotide pyrophosphohydrolase [Actinomycetes bacterium]
MKPKLTIGGLGPGGPDHLTIETDQVLAGASTCFLRTGRHPTAARVRAPVTFDHLYETADTFSDVYGGIVEALVEAATAESGVVYAVPGSPLVLEESVRRLRADERIEVELLPALSFLDVAWARLGVDPVDDGVRLVDGHQFSTQAAGERGPLLVAHTHASHVLSDIKLAIDAGPQQRVIVMQRLGAADESIFELAWPDLDRLVQPDHLTSLYLPEVTAPVAMELVRSVELMHLLRRDCPWDQEQDHQSLRKFLLEETHELLDAIDGLAHAVKSGADLGVAYQELEEELGDVWFQVLFHTELATEAGQFTIADVARTLHDKLVGRHPHVFGEVSVEGTDQIVSNWEQIKQEEKERASALDGVPGSLPALSLAAKILERARRSGAAADFGALEASSAEFLAPIDSEAALGAALLALVSGSGARGFDAEGALRGAVRAASDRFRADEVGGSISSDWVRG